MFMKNLKFILPILAFSLFSCTDYMDINESPNNLFFDQVTPKQLLPGAQVSTYRVQATTMNQLGNVFMNSWTRNVQSYGNGYDNELQLNVSNTFYSGIWDGLYRNLKNFDAIIKYPNPDGKYDFYVAAAKISKAHYMQYIVDLYGNCPYTEAWQGVANTTPAYDDDYLVYQKLIADLEDARDLINNADLDIVEDMSSVDVMLRGDTDKWIEFANTIELRMLLRMSNVTGAPATFRNAKLTEIASGPFLSDNVAINPAYNASTTANMNPAVSTFYWNVDQTNTGNRLFIAMAGHAYKSLQSYATTNYPAAGSQEIVPGSGVNYPNVTDPRSGRLFTAGVGTTVRRAVNQGASSVTVGPPTGTYPGPPSRLGVLGNVNPYDQAQIFSGVNLGYAIDFFGIDGFVMTYSEAQFLVAEAALRYPSLGFPDAQSSFEAGINDNFAFRCATPGSYVSQINTKPNFGWTGTDANKLHAIMFQKWIALMGTHGIESYIDYTRTGFPLTPLSSVAIQTRKPYRLIYPTSEYVANTANVPAMVANDAFAINALTPFWKQ